MNWIQGIQKAIDYVEVNITEEIQELLTPYDIQRDIIDSVGADIKAFEHVNYCFAIKKGRYEHDTNV